MTDSQIRELIGAIDHFHGNELKDRSEASVGEEITAIRGLLPTHQADLEGLEVELHRSDDGTLVASIAGPGDDDCKGKGEPDIRIWLNEALIYAHGEVGDDLSNMGNTTVKEIKDDS
jgi:hypothetical protein